MARPAQVVGDHPERDDVVGGSERFRVSVGERVSFRDPGCDIVEYV